MSDIPAGLDFEGFGRLAPKALAGLLALGRAASEGGIETPLAELVKLRVSALNGCAFCVRLHLDMARRAGVAAEKLDLLPAWRDVAVYSARERAALAWADALTDLADPAAAEAARAAVAAEFDEVETVFLAVTIGTINCWNRIARGLAFPPTPVDPAR